MKPIVPITIAILGFGIYLICYVKENWLLIMERGNWRCKLFGCITGYDHQGAWCDRTRGCHRPHWPYPLWTRLYYAYLLKFHGIPHLWVRHDELEAYGGSVPMPSKAVVAELKDIAGLETIPKEVRLHYQKGTLGGSCWSFNWTARDGRDICFFRNEHRNWSNLSQSHTREHCDDPAYCLWHGSL